MTTEANLLKHLNTYQGDEPEKAGTSLIVCPQYDERSKQRATKNTGGDQATTPSSGRQLWRQYGDRMKALRPETERPKGKNCKNFKRNDVGRAMGDGGGGKLKMECEGKFNRNLVIITYASYFNGVGLWVV